MTDGILRRFTRSGERPWPETPAEKHHRAKGNFDRVESQLAVHSASSVHPQTSLLISWAEYLASFLGWFNPKAGPVDPRQHIVWLFNNTAFLPPGNHEPFHAEVVAAIFEKNSREDFGMLIALIADLIGLDGHAGDDPEIRKRIAERLQPFVSEVAYARYISLEVPITQTDVHKYKLGPSNQHGIISHAIRMAPNEPIRDGTVVSPVLKNWTESITMDTIFAGPEGWLVVSDIDDTIKYTQTPDAVGILRTTFAEEPRPITSMPELYVHIQERLVPTWFYLSASPYNLYPFLRSFLEEHYPPGTMILRDASWQNLGGLLKSFTQGTQAYKADRIEKIHSWFPKRKILCIGDSTQSDPEAYAELFEKHGSWIQAIYIRRVPGLPNMEEKNSVDRFENAFKYVPRSVWKIFEDPKELYGLVDSLARG